MATSERPAIQRPLSPHLQVYRPQLTSSMSIAHRISGVFNAIAAFGLAWWLVAIAAGASSYATFAAVTGSLPGQLVLFAVTVSLMYHLCNGIRHLFWDAGQGLELSSVYRSGYAVLVVATLLTIVIWAVALGGSA